MNRKLLSLAAAAAIVVGAPAIASAQQGWQNIDQRQAQLDQRIDVGVRNGQITRDEAIRLRGEFDAIVRMEAVYRRDGLSMSERADLDRRFDALSAKIRYERADNDRGGQQGWQNINQRQAQLDQRIDVGVRNGQITRDEAVRLRAEFAAIVRMEAAYRRDGLSMSERADLDRRFDVLAAKVRYERADSDRNRGGARWNNVNLNERQGAFIQRLDRATRDGRITPTQARNLRNEYRTIAVLESQYRRGGLSANERADLNLRLERLQTNFRASVRSNQYAYGYGTAPNLFDYLFGLN